MPLLPDPVPPKLFWVDATTAINPDSVVMVRVEAGGRCTVFLAGGSTVPMAGDLARRFLEWCGVGYVQRGGKL